MSAIATQFREYEKLTKAMQQLDALENLKKVSLPNFYTEWRLLPLNTLHLVASRHCKSSLEWCFTNEWDRVEIFDKYLRKKPTLNATQEAVKGAITDQRNIVNLQKLYAVLSSTQQTSSSKKEAYKELAKQSADLFDQLRYCLKVGYGQDVEPEKGFIEKMIENNPDAPLHKEVITVMIRTLKKGHIDCRSQPHENVESCFKIYLENRRKLKKQLTEKG